jgi:DNA-binding NtrC family response regulator
MLFVGDDPDCALAIARWLRPYFQVIVAADCEEALKLVDDGNPVALLVTDLDGALVQALGLLCALRRRGDALVRRAIVYTREPVRAMKQLAERGLGAIVVDKARGLGELRQTALALRDGTG